MSFNSIVCFLRRIAELSLRGEQPQWAVSDREEK